MPTSVQITNNNQINTQQLCEIEALCEECNYTDGNTVAIYKHILSQNRPMPCNILCYQEKRLTGFLSTFFFYEDACEIVVMVAPDCRRHGIARQMLYKILPLIASRAIKNLIFSSPHSLNNTWLSTEGFIYKSSEYQMQRLKNQPVAIDAQKLVIRLATTADIETLRTIDNACFPTEPPNMSDRLQYLLNDTNYKLFIIFKDGLPIGKAHVFEQQDNARLTDIGILPHLQGRGFGGYLLAHCINYCLSINQSNIILDVETNNQQALNLYTHLGFSIINAYDFWSIPFNELIHL